MPMSPGTRHRRNRARQDTGTQSKQQTSAAARQEVRSSETASVPGESSRSHSVTPITNRTRHCEIIPYANMDTNGNLMPKLPAGSRPNVEESSSSVVSSTTDCAMMPRNAAASVTTEDVEPTPRDGSTSNSETLTLSDGSVKAGSDVPTSEAGSTSSHSSSNNGARASSVTSFQDPIVPRQSTNAKLRSSSVPKSVASLNTRQKPGKAACRSRSTSHHSNSSTDRAEMNRRQNGPNGYERNHFNRQGNPPRYRRPRAVSNIEPPPYGMYPQKYSQPVMPRPMPNNLFNGQIGNHYEPVNRWNRSPHFGSYPGDAQYRPSRAWDGRDQRRTSLAGSYGPIQRDLRAPGGQNGNRLPAPRRHRNYGVSDFPLTMGAESTQFTQQAAGDENGTRGMQHRWAEINGRRAENHGFRSMDMGGQINSLEGEINCHRNIERNSRYEQFHSQNSRAESSKYRQMENLPAHLAPHQFTNGFSSQVPTQETLQYPPPVDHYRPVAGTTANTRQRHYQQTQAAQPQRTSQDFHQSLQPTCWERTSEIYNRGKSPSHDFQTRSQSSIVPAPSRLNPVIERRSESACALSGRSLASAHGEISYGASSSQTFPQRSEAMNGTANIPSMIREGMYDRYTTDSSRPQLASLPFSAPSLVSDQSYPHHLLDRVQTKSQFPYSSDIQTGYCTNSRTSDLSRTSLDQSKAGPVSQTNGHGLPSNSLMLQGSADQRRIQELEVHNAASRSGVRDSLSRDEQQCANTLNPQAPSITTIGEEIKEEMARARRMSIPMNTGSTDVKSHLNPHATEFSPTLRDSLGNPYVMTNKKGMCYFRPKHDSNPNFVIQADPHSDLHTSARRVDHTTDIGLAAHAPPSYDSNVVPISCHTGQAINSNNMTVSFGQQAHAERCVHEHDLSWNPQNSGTTLASNSSVNLVSSAYSSDMHVSSTRFISENAPLHAARSYTTSTNHQEPLTTYTGSVHSSYEQGELSYGQQTFMAPTDRSGMLSTATSQESTVPTQDYAAQTPQPVPTMYAPGYSTPTILQGTPVTPYLGQEFFSFLMQPPAVSTLIHSAPIPIHTPLMAPQGHLVQSAPAPVIVTTNLTANPSETTQAPVFNLQAFYAMEESNPSRYTPFLDSSLNEIKTQQDSHDTYHDTYNYDSTQIPELLNCTVSRSHENAVQTVSNLQKKIEDALRLVQTTLRTDSEQLNSVARMETESAGQVSSVSVTASTNVTCASLSESVTPVSEASEEAGQIRTIIENLKSRNRNGCACISGSALMSVPESQAPILHRWLILFIMVAETIEQVEAPLSIHDMAELIPVHWREYFCSEQNLQEMFLMLNDLTLILARGEDITPELVESIECVRERLQAWSTLVTPSMHVDPDNGARRDASFDYPTAVGNDPQPADTTTVNSSGNAILSGAEAPLPVRGATSEVQNVATEAGSELSQAESRTSPPENVGPELATSTTNEVISLNSAEAVPPTNAATRPTSPTATAQATSQHPDSQSEFVSAEATNGPQRDGATWASRVSANISRGGDHQRRGSLGNVNIEGRISYFEQNGRSRSGGNRRGSGARDRRC